MTLTNLETGLLLFCFGSLIHVNIMVQVNNYRIKKMDGCISAKKGSKNGKKGT